MSEFHFNISAGGNEVFFYEVSFRGISIFKRTYGCSLPLEEAKVEVRKQGSKEWNDFLRRNMAEEDMNLPSSNLQDWEFAGLRKRLNKIDRMIKKRRKDLTDPLRRFYKEILPPVQLPSLWFKPPLPLWAIFPSPSLAPLRLRLHFPPLIGLNNGNSSKYRDDAPPGFQCVR